jgi:hypothetical protein
MNDNAFVVKDVYLRVIDEIVNPTVSSDKIALTLAKNHPDIFILIVNEINSKIPALTWHIKVANLIIENQKIDAIKCIRENTGLGLKEAKDIADKVNYEFTMSSKKKVVDHYSVYNVKLDSEMQQIADRIVNSQRG